ncbi:hypothetical protein COB55_03145 [Candidatus Wolfebacteria bacterium]|nr:MAG: hypothetical protein COB55_03145 [Candidatus Wolfebacteria bacterium]
MKPEIKKYKKKPVEIEALEWNNNPRQMYDFLTDKKDEYMQMFSEDFYYNNGEGGLIIKTSEGNMLCNIGDYVIKEPFDKDRKFYPCKPDIFKLTYEEES